MCYITHSFSLSENQKNKLARAYNKNKAVNIKYKTDGVSGNFPIMITKRQQNKIDRLLKKRLDLFLE